MRDQRQGGCIDEATICTAACLECMLLEEPVSLSLASPDHSVLLPQARRLESLDGCYP
jgi:hypothetical protein